MKRISTWLIIVGIVVLLIPIGGNLYMHYEQQRLYEEYSASLDKDIMDENFIDKLPEEEAQKEQTTIDPNIEGVIGQIEIPSISAELLLLKGSSGRELKYGAGHMESTALPGQVGNCAIAGHRDYTFGTYFSRLDEVETGDLINIESEGNSYVYKVTESFVVKPTEVSVLNQVDDRSILTLITCTPRGRSTHRLIVRAELMQ